MKDKTTIRYIGFRPAVDGGRLFDFCISSPPSSSHMTTFEIPAHFLTGDTRIRLQEGVGICYAKLKHLLELVPLADVPSACCLSKSDLTEYGERVHGSSRQGFVSGSYRPSEGR